MAKRERDSSSFVLTVIVSIVVNTLGDIPVVPPLIFLRTTFHNLFLNKKNLFLFSEKTKMLRNGTFHHKSKQNKMSKLNYNGVSDF